jgi:hypothetical protein
MGFTVKPGRPHQNGIENVSIKFADGSYVELITAHHGTDSLAKQYEEKLKTGEGASYLFLRDSTGAFTSDVVRSGGRREESGPFAFTELPGSWHVPRLQVIQYLSPAEDPADVYRHDNSARRVVAVWAYVGPEADRLMAALGAEPEAVNPIGFDNRKTRSVPLADETRLLLTPRTSQDQSQSMAAAILIEVESLVRLREIGALEGAVQRGDAVWLPPSQMHGVWMGFVERTKWVQAGPDKLNAEQVNALIAARDSRR